MDSLKTKNKFWLHFLSTPFICGPLIFCIVLDIVFEIYHQVCFPIYGLKKVNRKEYIQVLDRARLEYLNPIEKLYCMYCGYVNGVIMYWAEVAHRTERYWCGIMHENKPGYKNPKYQEDMEFAKFADKDDYIKKFK